VSPHGDPEGMVGVVLRDMDEGGSGCVVLWMFLGGDGDVMRCRTRNLKSCDCLR
jgi:hypothetical protein